MARHLGEHDLDVGSSGLYFGTGGSVVQNGG